MTSYVGEKIKELRLLSGLSQEELGNKVGVQRAAINKYEKGTVTNIPIATIEEMARVFDVSPTYLLGWGEHQGNPLAMEVKVLQGVKTFYGKESVDLLEGFTQLSPQGKKRVQAYVDDLLKIYTADTNKYM